MGIELFERVVHGSGQLLGAEVCLLGGRTHEVGALVLTFDVGRIAVRVEPRSQSLGIEFVASPEQVPTGLEAAREEEPWWRVIGSPLVAAWAGGPGHETAVCLQFRAADQSPRVICVEPRGGSVAIRLETSAD